MDGFVIYTCIFFIGLSCIRAKTIQRMQADLPVLTKSYSTLSLATDSFVSGCSAAASA